MGVTRNVVQRDNRANGLQDAESVTDLHKSLAMFTPQVPKRKQEEPNQMDPHLVSLPMVPETKVENETPQPPPAPKVPDNPPPSDASLVGNGLPSTPRFYRPFSASNSPMMSNAPKVDLQQNSMANGLLQNQQQHQAPLDNTWSGQCQGPLQTSPPPEEEVQIEMIRAASPGKAPQFILRNNPANSSVNSMNNEVMGFPAQRTPQRYYPRQFGGGMVPPEGGAGMMVGPGGMMMHPQLGLMPPGVNPSQMQMMQHPMQMSGGPPTTPGPSYSYPNNMAYYPNAYGPSVCQYSM